MVEVGRFEVIDGTNVTGFDTGDLVIVNYDADTDSILVTLNGSPITTGNVLLFKWINLGLVAVSYPNVQFCEGNNLVSFGSGDFNINRDFPYFPKNVELNSPLCNNATCVMSKVGSPIITPASGQGISDGSITLRVFNEFNGTVFFDFNNASFGSGYPATVFESNVVGNTYEGVINNVLPGVYSIEAVDQFGCRTSWKIEVPFIPTYGTRFRAEMVDRYNVEHRVDIAFRNYLGSVTDVVFSGQNGLIIETGGQSLGVVNVDKFVPALETKIQVTFKAQDNYNLTSLFSTAADRDIMITHYKKVGLSFVLQNQGFVNPEIYEENYRGAPYDLTLIAIDGISKLKEFDYPSLNGSASFINIIATCLQTLGLNHNIRSCMNLFEDSMNSGATDDPLAQLYVDQATFIGMKCDKVLGMIMQMCPSSSNSVGATVLSSQGYWWIFPVENVSNTVTYREFTPEGIYSSNGSVNMFRFIKGVNDTDRLVLLEESNSLRFDKSFKNIIINEKRDLVKSITTEWNPANIINQSTIFATFANWTLNAGADGGAFAVQVDKIFFKQATLTGTGQSFIETTGNIQFTRRDILKGSFKVFINPDGLIALGSNSFPYVEVRYSILINSAGNDYYFNGSDWTQTSTEVIVTTFLSNYNSEDTINIETFGMPDLGGLNSGTYKIKLYFIDPIKSLLAVPDLTQFIGYRRLGIQNSLNNFPASTLPTGYRLAIRSEALAPVPGAVFYFSLQEEGTVDYFNYFDANGTTRVWKLETAVFRRVGNNYTTYLASPEFITLPNGIELESEVTTTVLNNVSALTDLTIDLAFFDLDEGIFNGQNLIRNYLRLVDGTPTQLWGGQLLKNILRETYSRQFKFPSRILNFTARTDIDVSPFNTLILEDDNNRSYKFYDYKFNVRRQEISGEVIEIGSDTPITVGEYSNDYSDDFFN